MNQWKIRNLKTEIERSKNVQVNEGEFWKPESQKFIKKKRKNGMTFNNKPGRNENNKITPKEIVA